MTTLAERDVAEVVARAEAPPLGPAEAWLGPLADGEHGALAGLVALAGEDGAVMEYDILVLEPGRAVAGILLTTPTVSGVSC